MHWLDKVLEIFAAPTADLRVLAGIAGYDPKIMYKGTSLAGVDLSGQDVSDLDLDLGDVEELPFTSAKAKKYIIDNLRLPSKWADKILHFRASNRRIKNISQLEYCVGLREVKLNGTLITDISPLQKCDRLRNVEIENTNVGDIGALKNKKYLRMLNVSGTVVEDLSPLRGIPLNYLYISRTNVRDISEIDPEGLSVFEAAGLNIEDWSILSRAINMASIDLSSSNVRDLSFVTYMRRLFHLSISSTHAQMPEGASFPSLSTFTARNSTIADLSFLENSFGIYGVDIDNTLVGSIDPLRGKKNLRWFSSSNCNLKSIDGLIGCPNLYSVDVSRNSIECIDSLAEMVNLNRLNLAETDVKDLSFLKSTELKSLNVVDCKRLDWSTVSSLTSIVQLHLKEEQGDDGFENFYIPSGVRYLYANSSFIQKFWKELEERKISAFPLYPSLAGSDSSI